MKVLVIGYGNIAKRHIRNLKQLLTDPQFIIVRHSLGEDEEGLHFVRDTDSIDPTGIELAVLASPSHIRLHYLSFLIENKIPTYIEKPIVANRENYDALMNLMKSHAMPNMLSGCNFRFLPSLIECKQFLESEQLGELVSARFECGMWLPDWRPHLDYKKSYSAHHDRGGGVALDLIHEIDLARWMLGELTPIASHSYHCHTLDINAESVFVGLMKAQEGFPVTVHLDYVARKPVRECVLVGTHGTLRWNLFHKTLVFETHEGMKSLKSDPEDFDISVSYIRAMQSWLEQKNESTIEEGLKSVDLCLSLKEKEKVLCES